MTETARPPRRRQARGERRMAQLQDAAAEVFVEVGYEAATTNAIAARAGVSPGTLYQFFPNKEALAEALANRYLEQLTAAHDQAFGADLARLGTGDLIDRMVDPLIEVNLANPGFKTLFGRPDMPERLAAPTRAVQAAVVDRAERVLALHAPGLGAERRRRCAMIMVQTFAAVLPMVLAAGGADRADVVGELKRMLRGYLVELVGERL